MKSFHSIDDDDQDDIQEDENKTYLIGLVSNVIVVVNQHLIRINVMLASI